MDNFQAHILVVDDDEGIRSLVKKYLNERKYLVTTADNAENASEKIKIIKFDLIIFDEAHRTAGAKESENFEASDLDYPFDDPEENEKHNKSTQK